MQIYLVGGAVRDELLGLPQGDRDWVVVGATVDAMLRLGYKKVGKDFPVFLHPSTKEEYALARTEKKTGKGYYGFVCHSDPSVSLAEDLLRRDLTINAIAKDQFGNIIDPYAGQQDLANKNLRHVSAAFAEDPVRVLRLARFAAKFPDFNVDPATVALVKRMVVAGELKELVAERIWKEMERALGESAPWRFFAVLLECNALNDIMRPLLVTAADIARITNIAVDNICIYLALLLYTKDLDLITTFCQRVRMPISLQDALLLFCKYNNIYLNLNLILAENSIDTIIKFLQAMDVLRRPERINNYIVMCEYTYPEALVSAKLKKIIYAYSSVDVHAVIAKGYVGAELSQQIALAREQAVLREC
jgi:tRNA nucleotidyltransferase (CCA-adding enzyme)